MPSELWERQAGESAKAFAGFAHYRDSGPARSLRRTHKEVGASFQTVSRWSVGFRWVARVEAWDAEQDRQWRVDQTVARRRMADRHARIAGGVLNKVIERLQALDASALSPRDLIAWLDTATKVERLALGEPERLELTGRDGEAIQVSGSPEEVLAELRLISRELEARQGDG